MNRPDGYYGAVAENYQSSREVKAKWQAEQAAVDAFLTDGPVLDVPFGTGRFVPLYRAKGLDYTGIDISGDMLAQARARYGDVNANIGSAFDLRFREQEFGTAVCVRFLEWMPLDRAKALILRLAAIARSLIITINHGAEGRPEAYTYDIGKFLSAINGLYIEARRVTADIPNITSEIFKLRPAQWSDVVAQFAHDYPDSADANIQRIVDKHCSIFDLPPFPVTKDTVTVRAEYWSGERIGGVLRLHPRYENRAVPRREDGPLTVVALGPLTLLIDGRKRALRRSRHVGPHPVLVVRPNG